MTLTTCLSERFGEREGRVVSKHTSLFLGSRRMPHKSLVVEGFRVVL
jgi:hypothetical protein